MASELKSNNARSPRFSTTKALGFRGGSTSPGGNLQQATFQQTEGVQRGAGGAEEPGAGAPPISEFKAAAPKGPSLVGTLATGAGSAVAGEAAKQGLTRAGKAIGSAVSNYMTPKGYLPGGGYSSETMQQSFPTGAQSFAPGTRSAAMEVGGVPGVSPAITNAANYSDSYDMADADLGAIMRGGGDYLGDAATYGSDLGASFADTYDLADAAMGSGFDAAGAGVDAASGSVPIVGPLYQASQGNWGGAAGTIAGSLIGGPIGGTIGGFIGGMIGGDDGCFITEAVMSSGGKGDTAPELEALRQFRDQVLSTTPQGQALIQEYEQIAPMVVEAVMQRPDSLQIFQSIDAQFINPAVEAVNQGDFQKALQIYAQMISFVSPFAMETGEGGETMPAGMGGDMDAVQKMGEHAAMIGHSPEMANAATGDMGMSGMMDEDPNGYDGGPQGPQGQSPMMQQFAQPRY